MWWGGERTVCCNGLKQVERSVHFKDHGEGALRL
jgi:hypothetical protein